MIFYFDMKIKTDWLKKNTHLRKAYLIGLGNYIICFSDRIF